MPKDAQAKMTKKESNKKNINKREESNKRRKLNESSDDDASFYSDDESEDEMDVQEYRKFLKKIFPSKHLDNKIKAGSRLKNVLNKSEKESNEEDSIQDDSVEEEEPKRIITRSFANQTNKPMPKSKKNDNKKIDPNKKPDKSQNKKNKKIVVSDDEEYIGESDDEDEEDSDEDYVDEEYNPKSGKFNIIFTIGGKSEDDDYEDDDWETCSDSQSESNSDTENEDDPISSDSDSDAQSVENEYVAEKEEEESIQEKRKNTKKPKNAKKNTNLPDETKEKDNKDSEEDVVKLLKELQNKDKNNKLVNKCIELCEEKQKVIKKKQEKKIKKEKDRNSRIFKKMLRDKNSMNDFEFYNKLEIEQQKKIIKELREINKITRIEKPYRLTLLDSNMPIIFKAAAMKKIASLRYMEPGSGEFYKIKNWVDTFMRIPFGEYKSLPISINDGIDNCHEFMSKAQNTLDDAVYGLNDAKMQIMQMLGQLVTNPKALGSAIAIHGPPGTGKTSLVKEGISKILDRPFAFIALGGATDSSFLEGHSYTYEGSTWGKIVQILIDSKCMNPVIYFDELDKISDTPKGEEIAGILTHLTDTSQNNQFHDKYFADIDFDLSKCLFIFSYNDESKVNPILKDRMYRIQTTGYNQKQKTTISNNYLLPKIREQVKFKEEDIIIPDSTLHYIIENHCLKEDGVRNMKRCLEIIYTKLNLYRLMRPNSNLFEETMSLKVEFPFTVTKDIVDKLIKKADGINPSLYHLYV